MSESSILFPNLGITLANVERSINIGPVTIYYYAIVIALGMMIAFAWLMRECKRVGISQDAFVDVFMAAIILGIIGARIYYVVFSWNEFADDPLRILNIRSGGLAIYGGIIGGFLAICAVCRIKKLPLLKVLDITMPAVLIGQIVGRWGNFFNREVFGGYSDGLLAMAIPLNAVADPSDVTEEMLNNLYIVDGISFIKVHPTFLYESLWNLAAFLLLVLFFGKRQRFDGQIFAMYFILYGIGRFWIEEVRTDRLLIPGTALAVSQVLSALLIAAGVAGLIIGFLRSKKAPIRQEPEE